MGRSNALQKEKQYSLCSDNLLDYPSDRYIDRAEIHLRWDVEEDSAYTRKVMIARCFHSQAIFQLLKSRNLLTGPVVRFELKKILHMLDKNLKLITKIPNKHFEMQFLFHYYFDLLLELIRWNEATIEDFQQFFRIYNAFDLNGLDYLLLLKLKVSQLETKDKSEVIILISKNILKTVEHTRLPILDSDHVQQKDPQEFNLQWDSAFDRTDTSQADDERSAAYLLYLRTMAQTNPLVLINSHDYTHLQVQHNQLPFLNPDSDVFYLLRMHSPIPGLEDKLLEIAQLLIQFVTINPRYTDQLIIRLYQWSFLLEEESRAHFIDEIRQAFAALPKDIYKKSLFSKSTSIDEDLFTFLEYHLNARELYHRIIFSRLNLSLEQQAPDLARKNLGQSRQLGNAPIPLLLYAELLLTVPFADAAAKYQSFLHKYSNSYRTKPHDDDDVLDIHELLMYHEAKIANLYQMLGPRLFDLLNEKLGGSPLKANRFLNTWILFKSPYVLVIRQLIERYPVTFNNTRLLTLIINNIPLLVRMMEEYADPEEIDILLATLSKADSSKQVESLIFVAMKRTLSMILRIPLAALSDQKMNELGLEDLSKIVLAREQMSEDEYLTIFDAMLRCDLSDSEDVSEVIHDPEGWDLNLRKLAEHNTQIKNLLVRKGINIKTAATYPPSEPFTFTPQKAAEQLDRSGVVLDYLRQLHHHLKANSSLFQDKSLFPNVKKDLYLRCIKTLDYCINELAQSAPWLTHQESRQKLASLNGRIKGLIKDQPPKKVCSIAEFSEHLSNELQHLRKGSQNKKKSFANRSFHVEQWDKNHLKTFLLGNQLSCCLATDSARFPAMVQRRMDSGMFMHVVIDEQLGEPVCGAWLFYSDEQDVVANFFDLRDSYAQNQELSALLIQQLLDYTQLFTEAIGARQFIWREVSYGNLKSFFSAQMYPQLEDGFMVNKIGGFFCLNQEQEYEIEDRYFLDAVTNRNTHFFRYIPPEIEPVPDQEMSQVQPG